MMKMKLVITVVTLAVLGLVLVWWRIYKKLPKSLSQMVLEAPEWKIIFAAMLALYGGAAWFCFVDRLPDSFQWLLWLMEVGLAMVAMTPLSNKNSHGIHNTGAVLSSVTITVLATLLCPWTLLVWILYVAYTLLTDCEHKKLVAEVLCGLVLTLMILFSPL